MTFPTRDARNFVVVNIGPRFGNAMQAFKYVISNTAATIFAAPTVSSNVGQLGACGTDPPFGVNHSSPLAVRSHRQWIEICNLNKSPIIMNIGVWRWKTNHNYPGVNLTTEIYRTIDSSGGMVMTYGSTPTPSASWQGATLPASFVSPTGLMVESLFGQRRTVFDRQYVKKLSWVKVVIAPSGVYKFSVPFPRMWPIYTEDVIALDYLFKSKIDRAISLEWHSPCGILPVSAVTADPVAADIHTEKQIIAVRMGRLMSGVRYAYEPFVQVVCRDIDQFAGPVPARSGTTRAEKPHVHQDNENIAATAGQSSD